MLFEEERRRELIRMNSKKLKNFEHLQKIVVDNGDTLISCARLLPNFLHYNEEKKCYCFTVGVKDKNVSFDIDEDKVKNNKTLSNIVAAAGKGKSMFLDIKGNMILSDHKINYFIPTSMEIVTKKVFNALGIMSDKEIDKKIEEEKKLLEKKTEEKRIQKEKEKQKIEEEKKLLEKKTEEKRIQKEKEKQKREEKMKQKTEDKMNISATYRTRIPDQNDPEYTVLNPDPKNKGVGFFEFDDPDNPQKGILYLSFSEYGRGLEFLENMVSLDTFQIMVNTQYLNFIYYCSKFMPEFPSDFESLIDLSQKEIYGYINLAKEKNPDLLEKFHKDTENDVHIRIEMDDMSNNAKVNLRIGDTWAPTLEVYLEQESPSMSM